MSVVSKNPFELLDDGEERAPSPAPKTAPAAKAATTSKQPKVIPGAAQKGGRGARAPTAPRPTYGAAGGDDGFEGERVAPPKKEFQGRDRHTKGPREDRSHTGPRSRAPGAAGARGPKGGNRGGRGGAAGAGGAPGAEKKTGAAPAESWTNEEGKAELSAENQGEKDAEAVAETPAAQEEEEAEPEDNSKTLDQYLAERTAAALGGDLGKKEARQVSEKVEGKQFEREEMENFFVGGKAKAERKEKPKKEKIYIEVDGQFAQPARAPRGDRAERGSGRGGRGGQRGRGAPRGGAARAPRQAAPANVADESAFPALGS